MTIAPNILYFAYISRFVLGFTALNVVTLRKTASRFYDSLNRFRDSNCYRLSTLLKTSPAFKRRIFGGITMTRAFRRIWHGDKVKKNQ
jgi:hypothetical protein